MRIVPFFPPLAQRAAEMRRDVVRSILRKRFDPRAPARCEPPPSLPVLTGQVSSVPSY